MDGLFTTSRYLTHSPFRTPDWRWHRATRLLSRRKRLDRRVDDEWVARARHFQAAQQLLDQGTAPRPGHSACPDATVANAFRLWQGTPEQRHRLEAYLLTQQPFEEIASRCAVPAVVAETYHQLFFCVRPHLGACDWIMARAIGGDIWHGLAAPEALWKYAAYAAGPNALEAVIAISTDRPLPPSLQQSFGANTAYEEARFRLRGKLCLAALAATSAEELAPLVEIHEQFQRLDRQATGAPDADTMLGLMGRFLRMVARRSRSPSPSLSQPTSTEVEAKPREPAATTPTRRCQSNHSAHEQEVAR